MKKTIDIRTKKSLAKLLSEVERYGEIVVTRAGKPVAKLVATKSATKMKEPLPKDFRKPGFLKGKIWIGPDFYDPLPDDILKAFFGEGD